ncbi:hypothetical protein KDW46_02205 [Burkholderia vietnamiensis]|nr:hypothetical protein [Burkholderia vietnamiensis]
MKITDDMLTGWFPPHIKPVHAGTYPVEWAVLGQINRGFAHWDGRLWGNTTKIAGFAKAHAGDRKSAAQNKSWRGLKEKHHG